jgi:hypothetical protein
MSPDHCNSDSIRPWLSHRQRAVTVYGGKERVWDFEGAGECLLERWEVLGWANRRGRRRQRWMSLLGRGRITGSGEPVEDMEKG